MGIMLLQVELTLYTTKDIVWMYNFPVKEVEMLHSDKIPWKSLTTCDANNCLGQFNNAKTLNEVFIDNGAYVYSMEQRMVDNKGFTGVPP